MSHRGRINRRLTDLGVRSNWAKGVGWGSKPLSSRMSAGGRISNVTHTYTRKAITNTDAYTHTHSLTQRLGCIIPDLPAHCGDLSLNQTCCLHREQVSDQVSAVCWRLAASSQLTSHQNLATRRGDEFFQTKWNQQGLCHRNGLNYVSCQPMLSQRILGTQDWGLVAKLGLLKPFLFSRNSVAVVCSQSRWLWSTCYANSAFRWKSRGHELWNRLNSPLLMIHSGWGKKNNSQLKILHVMCASELNQINILVYKNLPPQAGNTVRKCFVERWFFRANSTFCFNNVQNVLFFCF